MRDYPNGVKRIYDNGGKTVDRYTVYYYQENGARALHVGRGMSAEPFHPQGVGQWVQGDLGPHNGRLINFAALPEDCRKAVLQDLA